MDKDAVPGLPKYSWKVEELIYIPHWGAIQKKTHHTTSARNGSHLVACRCCSPRASLFKLCWSILA